MIRKYHNHKLQTTLKPVHGIDNVIAKFVFGKCVEKNGYVYFPDNIDI